MNRHVILWYTQHTDDYVHSHVKSAKRSLDIHLHSAFNPFMYVHHIRTFFSLNTCKYTHTHKSIHFLSKRWCGPECVKKWNSFLNIMGFLHTKDSENVVYKITPKSCPFSARQLANFASTWRTFIQDCIHHQSWQQTNCKFCHSQIWYTVNIAF